MTTLFEVPEDWWHRRCCQVCGGALSVTCSHTYAMQRQGWVKIGASSNPAERYAVLGMQCPGARVRAPEGMEWSEPILLLGVIEGDVEHQLHEQFAAYHACGEWFLPAGEMLDWLGTSLMSLAEAGLPTRRVSKKWIPRQVEPEPALAALW